MMTRTMLATAVILAGCGETTLTGGGNSIREAKPASCNAAAYTGFIGQDAVVALQIPEPKRSYRPEDVLTADFNASRVNIVLDDTDTIVGIKCG